MQDLRNAIEQEINRLQLVKIEALENDGAEIFEQMTDPDSKHDFEEAAGQLKKLNNLLHRLESLENRFAEYLTIDQQV